MDEPDYVLTPCTFDEDGEQCAMVTLTPDEDQREKIILVRPMHVIPILFLPGIMGTNLRDAKSRKSVWRPPNMDARGIADAFLQLIAYAFTSARGRAEGLVMNRVEIDPDGPIDPGRSNLPSALLASRGWGALMRGSYHPILADLEYYLNHLCEYNFERSEVEYKEWSVGAGAQAPTEWGSPAGEPLTREEIFSAARYRFDVWAGGYNWLQSNQDSARQIQRLIEKTIRPYYNGGVPVTGSGTADGQGKQEQATRMGSERVIVVTHSMGGLVSRALTGIHRCESVLGVSHGVQPATGAPATYKRMRAGFEGPEQIVLGRNAAEVTAVLSQSPGGLELLPTADYNGGKPWLFVREPNRQGRGREPILALPQSGDPYAEIYQSTAWYGLVPEHNEGMLALGAKAKEKSNADVAGVEDRDQSPRIEFEKRINQVKKFHEDIRGHYADPTYVHYGAQGKRDRELDTGGLFGSGWMASGGMFAWGEVAWEGRDVAGQDPGAMRVVMDDGNGVLRTNNGIRLTIADPDTLGDGTVPVQSGAAPAGQPGVAMTFAHGHGSPGAHNARFGYDHQGSYNDERALYATLYAIVKIAQQADWHPATRQSKETSE